MAGRHFLVPKGEPFNERIRKGLSLNEEHRREYLLGISYQLKNNVWVYKTANTQSSQLRQCTRVSSGFWRRKHSTYTFNVSKFHTGTTGKVQDVLSNFFDVFYSGKETTSRRKSRAKYDINKGNKERRDLAFLRRQSTIKPDHQENRWSATGMRENR